MIKKGMTVREIQAAPYQGVVTAATIDQEGAMERQFEVTSVDADGVTVHSRFFNESQLEVVPDPVPATDAPAA